MDKQIVTQHTAIYCNENSWSFLRTGIEKLNPTKIFILVDTNTHTHCHELFIKNAGIKAPVETIIMPSGEKNKTIHHRKLFQENIKKYLSCMVCYTLKALNIFSCM